MTIQAESTLLDAIVDELASVIEADARTSAVKLHRGWPGDLGSDAFVLPAIAVMAIEGEAEQAHNLEHAVIDHGDGTITQLFERESIPFDVMVELWCKTKTERAVLELALRNILSGGALASFGTDEPGPPGLTLTLSRYWDARVRVRVIKPKRWDANTTRLRYARTTFECETVAPRIEAVKYNKATIDATDVEVSTQVEI